MSSSEVSVLNKGLKFAKIFKLIPYLDIIASVKEIDLIIPPVPG